MIRIYYIMKESRYKEMEEKFAEWESILFDRFLVHSKNALKDSGCNIPMSYISSSSGKGNVGDGTIHLANLMTYIWIGKKNGKTFPIDLSDCLNTLKRLESKSYEYFKESFPHLFNDNDKGSIYKEGFFVRDDIDGDKVDWGNWKMLHSLVNEDPCHSPFISQDQVWNLNPILSKIMLDTSIDEYIRDEARRIGYSINDYIKANNYTIYNPYLSYINHFFEFLPPFNYNLAQRVQYRLKKFKPNIKVKRGANNWYYSGGTSAAHDAFRNNKFGYKHNLRTFIYRGVIFFLDKIYEPIYRLFTNSDFKHNSYYCYGATSGIWYSGNYADNFLDRFNKSLKGRKGEREELFESNIAPIVLYGNDKVDKESLGEYLYKYPKYNESDSIIYNPLEGLILFEFYKNLISE